MKTGITAELAKGKKEVISKEELVKLNLEIEEWKPHVSYPQGSVIRYLPNKIQN